MTCEVAVMNKWGVALAADSAVTLGNARKIFYGAQKLFCLSQDVPVGILTYGSAEIMGTPWEVVIKMYTRQRGGLRFDRLDQHAADFLQFIETSHAMFPEDLQAKWLVGAVSEYWTSQILGKLKTKKQQQKRPSDKLLRHLIKEDHAIWAEYEDMPHLGTEYGERVIENHRKALVGAAKKVFKGIDLGESTVSDLLGTARAACTKRWIHPDDRSGIVFAGMGDVERFPSLLNYAVGAITEGKLRYYEKPRSEVTQSETAHLIPLAQREVMDSFIMGIHPELRTGLLNVFKDTVHKHLPNAAKSRVAAALGSKDFESTFDDALVKVIDDKFRGPLMSAVDGLPRADLAVMAEALVNLTVFKARMTVDQVESVGGPIDVAVISKGDGFVWVKRKN